jgi:hypothetical protein
MARWTPSSDVGQNERIGRRLFDEPMLAGAGDQKPYYGLDFRHFYETRDDISLDRLGRTGIDNAVVRYLTPLAHAAGRKFRKAKSFNGWFVVVVRNIENPPEGNKFNIKVIASAVQGEGLEENPYHAHIFAAGIDHYFLGLHLRHLFAKYGQALSVQQETASPSRPPLTLDYRVLWRWIREEAARLFKRRV